MRLFKTAPPRDEHYTLLMNDLKQTTVALRDAYNNLANVVDPDLIDCYIYQLNSVQMRYKFLLSSLKTYKTNIPAAK